MRARIVGPAVAMAVTLAAGACGGDDDSTSSDAAASEAAPTEVVDGEPTAPASDPSGSPEVGEHWHSAYLIEVCGQQAPPLPATEDPLGIHSHADGVIHIHPFEEAAAGDNATLGLFGEAVGLELSDDRLGIAFADFEITEADGCGDGQPAELRVARWAVDDLDAEPEIVTENLADVRFRQDLEAFTISFGDPASPPSLPSSIRALAEITDVEVPPDLPDDIDDFFPEPARPEPPGPGEAVSGETPCPEPDGSSRRTTSFEGPPPSCIEEGVTYSAVFDTSEGEIVVELDTASNPVTANNFIVLARYGYYDDTAIFRTAPSIDIVQGGAPTTNDAADPGPGYTIPDEGVGYTYQPGDLVMARTSAPDSAGAQYFFSTGAATANLDADGSYVVFGATSSGLDVLEAVIAMHVEDPADPLRSGPAEPVIVNSVTIVETR